jgi:large subunit ribosomal protein L25
MASQKRPTLTAEPRERGRKSHLHSLRRDGIVPGSVFGHGDPELIQVPARSLKDYLRHHPPGGLLDVEVNGKRSTALIRELERDPLSGEVITLGLQRVNLRETIKASVPLQFVGEEALIANHLVFARQMSELEVSARADRLPEAIVIDVSEREAGDTIRIGDLQLPEGVEPTKDADLPVATVAHPKVDAETAAALDAEEAEHEAMKAEHEVEAAEAEAESGEASEEPAGE